MILRMVCRAFAANGGFLMECCWPRYAGVLSAGERSTPTAAKEYRALSDTLGSPTAISTSLSNCSWVVLGLGLRALLTEGLTLLQKQTARAVPWTIGWPEVIVSSTGLRHYQQMRVTVEDEGLER